MGARFSVRFFFRVLIVSEMRDICSQLCGGEWTLLHDGWHLMERGTICISTHSLDEWMFVIERMGMGMMICVNRKKYCSIL